LIATERLLTVSGNVPVSIEYVAAAGTAVVADVLISVEWLTGFLADIGVSLEHGPITVAAIPDAGLGELFPADVLGVIFPPSLPGNRFDIGVFGA
jgi:hypothetical protein